MRQVHITSTLLSWRVLKQLHAMMSWVALLAVLLFASPVPESVNAVRRLPLTYDHPDLYSTG